MFNAESLIDVIRESIIRTEVATTRALADEIRKLPAGFPPSEIADALDALATETNDRHPRVDTRGAALLDPTPPDCAICHQEIGDRSRVEFQGIAGVVSHADCVERVGAVQAMAIHRRSQLHIPGTDTGAA